MSAEEEEQVVRAFRNRIVACFSCSELTEMARERADMERTRLLAPAEQALARWQQKIEAEDNEDGPYCLVFHPPRGYVRPLGTPHSSAPDIDISRGVFFYLQPYTVSPRPQVYYAATAEALQPPSEEDERELRAAGVVWTIGMRMNYLEQRVPAMLRNLDQITRVLHRTGQQHMPLHVVAASSGTGPGALLQPPIGITITALTQLLSETVGQIGATIDELENGLLNCSAIASAADMRP